jgi:hypothetical protein
MKKEFNATEKLTLKLITYNLKYNTFLGGFVIKNNQIEIIDRDKFKQFSVIISVLCILSIIGIIVAILAPFL